MRPKQENFAFPTPNICAWCGSPNPTKQHIIKSQEQKLTGFYLVAYKTSTTTYKLPLPVCDKCEAQLQSSHKSFIVSCVVGGVLGAVTGFTVGLLLNGFEIYTCSMNIVLGITAGIILGMIFGKLVFKENPWGRIADGKIEFYNESFRNAFHALRLRLAQEREQTRENQTTNQ